MIVGVRDLVAISGWIALRAGEALANTEHLRHDSGLDTDAAVADIELQLRDMRRNLEVAHRQFSDAHNIAAHLSRPLATSTDER